jgi:aspartyl-tRNA(Asn)/glutamyl-tRNA(Gln) amidotransferase subunit C
MIDPDTFSHLVELASFEFEPDQADYLRDQLNNQLKTIQELEAVPIDENITVEIHGVPFPQSFSQALRKDTSSKFADRDELIGQFPRFEDGYVIVPDIPHQELD